MDQKTLDALGAWASGKAIGNCMSTVNALSAVAGVREFLHSRRTLTGIFSQEPVVDEQEWLKFYNSPKTLELKLLEATFGNQASEYAATMDALRNPVGADCQSKLRAFGLIAGCFAKLDDSDWPELIKHVLDEALSEAEVDESNELDNAAMTFYFWVHLPCWLVYGVSPTDLLRQLPAGGKLAEKAAERLVRLDHHVILHAKLQRWINTEEKIAVFRRKKVQAWKSRTPFDKEKSSSHALRVVAGYVSRSSELLGERLEAPEVRNAIQALGKEVPADLQAYLTDRTNDDWSREIRRHRDHLVKVANPDKSAIESVRALFK
jgi:hypothetical protein